MLLSKSFDPVFRHMHNMNLMRNFTFILYSLRCYFVDFSQLLHDRRASTKARLCSVYPGSVHLSQQSQPLCNWFASIACFSNRHWVNRTESTSSRGWSLAGKYWERGFLFSQNLFQTAHERKSQRHHHLPQALFYIYTSYKIVFNRLLSIVYLFAK